MKNLMRKFCCVSLFLFLLCVVSTTGFTAQKVNINKASVAELVTLKGIGEKTATSIVEYRTTHGDFKTVAELVNVKGVGDKVFAKLADQIVVADEIAKK